MKSVLLIDDAREVHHCYPGSDYAALTARNYKSALFALAIGHWDVILLDHDLGDFSPDGREFTGYDVLCKIEELHHNGAPLPGEIRLVTSNPSARIKMQAVVDKLYGKGR